MINKFGEILLKIGYISPTTDLRSRILLNVAEASSKRRFWHVLVGSVMSVASLVAVAPLFVYTIGEFYRSGFVSFISLIFTDSGVVMSNFNEYALSVMDSVPFWAITITLTSILLFLISARYLITGISNKRSRLIISL